MSLTPRGWYVVMAIFCLFCRGLADRDEDPLPFLDAFVSAGLWPLTVIYLLGVHLSQWADRRTERMRRELIRRGESQ